MLYDIQKVVRDNRNQYPGLQTDLVTGSRRRIRDRVLELKKRKQGHRVIDQTGTIVPEYEIVNWN